MSGDRDDESRTAFLLIRAPNAEGKNRYLLQKRADSIGHGGTWGIPGGHCHVGEDPWDAAVRESTEEMGELPPLHPTASWERSAGDRAVFTYLIDLPEIFRPPLDGKTPGEIAGWAWFARRHIKDLPLHPSFRETWDGIDWGEVGKSAAGYTLSPRSGTISLDLPAGLITPLPGGVDDHHITVVYLGPDVDDAAFTSACLRTAQAASDCPPLTGTIGGLGASPPSAGSDGKVPVFAQVDLPGAEKLRAALEDLSASEHTQWKPHVTLAYLDADDPLPPEPPLTAVTFTELSVHRGDDVMRFPLGEPLAKAVMTPAQWQVQQIASEAAIQMSNQLGGAVNPGQLAQQWLNRYAHKGKPRRRKTNTRQRQRPAPARYLNTTGAAAAIQAVLTAILIELWAAAWIAGVSLAALLLGLGAVASYGEALAYLEAEGRHRAEGMTQTRLSRIERVLMAALAEGWDADRLAGEIRAILESMASALLVTITEAQWASQWAMQWACQMAGVTHGTWITREDADVCPRCKKAQAAGPVPIGRPFPGTDVPFPPGHPRCRCRWWPVLVAAKSERTPMLSTTHNPLGPHGLWHTPSEHHPARESLPDYVENVAHALERAGHSESESIALAIASVKAWAAGHAFGGKVRVTPEVQAAAQMLSPAGTG